MDNITEDTKETYEVEKIINCKIYKNKKYYLIKWLCYPIYESTWEPKSNLKGIDFMINRLEQEYPYSIDQYMYEIYCAKLKKAQKEGVKEEKIQENQKNPLIKNFYPKRKRLNFFRIMN